MELGQAIFIRSSRGRYINIGAHGVTRTPGTQFRNRIGPHPGRGVATRAVTYASVCSHLLHPYGTLRAPGWTRSRSPHRSAGGWGAVARGRRGAQSPRVTPPLGRPIEVTRSPPSTWCPGVGHLAPWSPRPPMVVGLIERKNLRRGGKRTVRGFSPGVPCGSECTLGLQPTPRAPA